MQRAQLALIIALVAAVSGLLVSSVRTRAALEARLDKLRQRSAENGKLVAELRREVQRLSAGAVSPVRRRVRPPAKLPPISAIQFIARWNREMAARAGAQCWKKIAPDGEPVIRVRAQVSADGVITGARKLDARVNQRLADCVIGLLETMRLPKSRDGKPYVVDLQTQRPNAFVIPSAPKKRAPSK